jgi:type III restriction enzyme
MCERHSRGPFPRASVRTFACHGSQTQLELTTLAANIVDYFEDRVGYQDDPDPDRAIWRMDEYRPRGKEMIDFDRAAHRNTQRRISTLTSWRSPELSIESNGLIWDRNPTTESQGFGIPLPKKVGDSSTFYPDFLIFDLEGW